MKAFIKYIICLSVAFGSALASYAQTNAVDAALDQYDALCRKCIELKTNALAGEKLPESTFAQLLGDIATIRQNLSGTSTTMTPSQKLRLQSIKLRFEEAFPKEDKPAERTAVARVLPHSLPIIQSPALYAATQELRPIVSAAKAEPIRITKPVNDSKASIILLFEPTRSHIGIMGTYNPYGILGGYLKGTVSMNGIQADYKCYSDGVSTTGNYFWTTGKRSFTGNSISAGLTLGIFYHTSIYAGIGYRTSRLLWEDALHNWAEVYDYTYRGASADAGVMISIKTLRLLAGVSSIGLKAATLEMGVGFSF